MLLHYVCLHLPLSVRSYYPIIVKNVCTTVSTRIGELNSGVGLSQVSYSAQSSIIDCSCFSLLSLIMFKVCGIIQWVRAIRLVIIKTAFRVFVVHYPVPLGLLHSLSLQLLIAVLSLPGVHHFCLPLIWTHSRSLLCPAAQWSSPSSTSFVSTSPSDALSLAAL